MERIEWTPIARQWIADDPQLALFTDRQRVVVRLIADGLSVETVSDRLGIGIRSVRSFLTQARTRVEIKRVRARPLSSLDSEKPATPGSETPPV